MEYITFTNAAGIEHKAWSTIEQGKYICFRLEDATAQPERLWPQKVFDLKEQADAAILKYVNAGIKAKVFVNYEIG